MATHIPTARPASSGGAGEVETVSRGMPDSLIDTPIDTPIGLWYYLPWLVVSLAFVAAAIPLSAGNPTHCFWARV
jgi:hypothetical protein